LTGHHILRLTCSAVNRTRTLPSAISRLGRRWPSFDLSSPSTPLRLHEQLDYQDVDRRRVKRRTWRPCYFSISSTR
jgi:hypothetical protein